MVLNQNELYYQRMASSVGDKARLLQHLTGTSVLEIGFGGGELLDILHEEGYLVYGLDASAVSESKVINKPYGVRTVEGFADEIKASFGDTKFDNVILSSVMHEVFSYGNRNGAGKHSLVSFDAVLREIYDALNPGGRILIRDGVLAENWEDKVQLVMLNGDNAGVDEYLDLQPFKDRVSLIYQGDDTYLGNLESVTAFAYTYTWGPDALPRESQELFGVLTRKEYATLLQSHGFNMLVDEEYVQEGYVHALSPKMDIRDMDGNALPFPSTNAIWVAEKS